MATAISDVVPVDGDEFLAALRRLLFLPELVVFPATLVFPQLPVSTFRSERTHKLRRDLYMEPSMNVISICDISTN